MSGHADTIRHYLVQYLPDGFRDEAGVWHEGPHRTQSLAALDALLAENADAKHGQELALLDADNERRIAGEARAENQRLRDALEFYAERVSDGVRAREALAGDAE